MMDITVKTKGVEIFKSVMGQYTIYSHIFSYVLTAFIISQYSVQWGRMHFATFMCNTSLQVTSLLLC